MGMTPFQLEAWIEFAIGIVILFSRIAYRTKLVGRNWAGDDYFAVAAVCFLTGETAMLHVIGQWGSIVGMTDEKALKLSEQEKATIVKGAKADIAGWCLYITLIWCLKACMLFFYRRLTLDTFQKRLVLVAGVAWICSYAATIGVVLLRCLPFKRNWQVYPYPGDECGTPNQIFLTLVITNVSTDLLILYIPLPLLWVVKIPLGKKIIYCLWLTTGVFVIVASLLRCVLSIRYANEVDVSTIWAIRETFVGIICVNAPILGPWLVKKGSVWAHSISSSRHSSKNNDRNAGLPTIITIGQRSMRLGRPKKDGKADGRTGATTGWTTINDSDECVVELQDTNKKNTNHHDDGGDKGDKKANQTIVASMAASSTTAVNEMV
ncbi:hypothetical protein V2A60_002011 [Cordyceps javanica]|uniref:Integral membrane protein PTH11 n=1 Tax=Cordyceps javanica TaxID=43265 RepID=A0A545VGY6_9HYPO|nr:integral membrane protein PTH11 [Cordyceps javanica]TQW12149.1 integral membrane protein PTH11 [Cordyceps javanica]